MIRNAKLNGWMRSLPILLLAIGLFLTSFPVISRAGDQDGLGGYSLQLKRKYFDGSGSGSGGSGQSIYPDPKSSESPYSPQTTNVELSRTPWTIDLHQYFDVFGLWLK